MSDYMSDTVGLYLNELIDWETYFTWRKGADVDVEAERAALYEVVQTAAAICSEMEDACREHWEEHPNVVDGEVVLPAHIQTFYDKLAEAGLVSWGVAEQYGGFGLPSFIGNLIMQMVSRADAGLMTVIGLQAGVAEDIQLYANDELKQQWLPMFASGEVMGAMDLTEPQAGSDLGAITTRADQQDDHYVVTGDKIWITSGGSRVHLVLARDGDTYEESKGTTRGLSLILVPRTLLDGTENRVSITRLEEKLGIHSSPTAAIHFEQSTGYLIGEKGQGFKAMLTLMNNARMGVAAQGIGIGEAALSTAVRYAHERVQFGQPIAEQPLMKDKLAGMTILLEGARAILYRAGALIDRNRAIQDAIARGDASEAEKTELQAEHERNETRIRLLTPLAKYMGTEAADQITRDAIQVHGGVGFMRESEVGKLHNDAIITTIYEGTSEIQVSFALKEIGKGALGALFEAIETELKTFEDAELKEYADKVLEGMQHILDASGALLSDFSYALASAQSLAEAVSSVIAGAELLKQAKADPRRFDIAASWINRRMVDLESRCKRIKSGSADRIERADRIIATVG